jgi:Uma2 family endonuclease
MATASKILTYEEWLQMPTVEDGREEVVNGEIICMPPNRYTHADVIQNLIEALLPRIPHQETKILGSSVSLMIRREPLTCRAPDLLVYWRKNLVRDKDDVLRSAPDLLIEVLSPSETKRRKTLKLADYATIGVPEVWIVSPEAQLVEIHLLAEGKLPLSQVIAEGNLEPTRFPGVSIPVLEFWPEESEEITS